MQKYLILLLLVLQSSIIFSQQLSQSLRILDSKDKSPIPYAHISSEQKLIAVSDYSGYFSLSLNDNYDYIKISTVGYQSKKIQYSSLKFDDKTFIIYLSQSSQKLNEVIITPNSLKDMIAEVYREIPNKYYPEAHKLIGDYSESYKDTLNEVIAMMKAEIIVSKDSYFNRNNKGEVEIIKYHREIQDSASLEYLIGAGPHIPHRFDFVMRREDFINPSKFNQYNYTFIDQVSYRNRVVDIIGFEPKKSGAGASFYGKLYIDFKEKVFIKAEYNYTKFGFFANRASNWAQQRKFIAEYEIYKGKWYLNYTWDEAVSASKNFKLTQEFYTRDFKLDTLESIKYAEQFKFKDVFLLNNDTTIQSVATGTSKEEILEKLYEQNKALRIMTKIEIAFGIKALRFNHSKFTVNNAFNFNDTNLSTTSSFEVYDFEPAFASSYSYRIGKNWLIDYNAAGNFRKKWKVENYEIGISKRLPFKTSRPTFLKLGIAYQGIKNTFNFSKIDGFTPKYEKKYSGLNGSIKFEIELNPRKRFYIGYNYAHQLTEKDKFYLERKHGFLNLKKEKTSYELSDINLEVDGVSSATFPNVFIDSALSLGLLWSFGL